VCFTSCSAKKGSPEVFLMTDEKSKLVYSTGKLVPRKERSSENSVNPAQQETTATRNVIVRLERKKRGGKSVTVIEGLRIPEKEREMLLRKLKTGLGTGGALKDASLEIQGDHRDALIAALTKMGYSPKCSGG